MCLKQKAQNISLPELLEVNVDLTTVDNCLSIRELAQEMATIPISNIHYPALFAFLNGIGITETIRKKLVLKKIIKNLQPYELHHVTVNNESYLEFLIAGAFCMKVNIKDGKIRLYELEEYQDYELPDNVPVIPFSLIKNIDSQYDLIECYVNNSIDVYPVRVKGRPYKENVYIVNKEELHNALDEIAKRNLIDIPDFPTSLPEIIVLLTSKINRCELVSERIYYDMILQRYLADTIVTPYTLEDAAKRFSVEDLGPYEKYWKGRLVSMIGRQCRKL